MWAFKLCAAVFLASLIASASVAQPARPDPQHSSNARNNQEKSSTPDGKASALDKVVEQIIQREQNEITAFALYKPIVETYIQQLKPNKEVGFLPDHDAYFIGQADLARGVAVRSMLPRVGGVLGVFGPPSEEPWNAGGFLQMIYIDRDHFDRGHYEFHYAGRDFLGEVRCLMFDLTPAHKSGKGRFEGRIWVEDHDYTIVRFSGVYVHDKLMTHFDSWRLNAQPDLWLPAYVFIEELKPKAMELPRFKAQTYFWAYSPTAASHEDEFSDLVIEGDNKQVQDDSDREHDRSPIQEEREFEREGEDNAIDTLVRAGLIAPEGDVDKVLDTVLNNLEVTNHLDIDPEPRCRVILTSNIELFAIGHTIVLSRGLLDVLPDEPTLAVMLAQALSEAMASKGAINQYGFSDVLQTPSDQALKKFSFKESQEDWQATGVKALEIIGNSPYRSNLGTAALFLQQLSEESKLLPHLIGPHLGNEVYPIAALVNSGPRLEADKIDQIAALPMGSRVKLDPWNDTIEITKAAPVKLLSAREKMPFEVTPFMPYLTRYRDAIAAGNSAQANVSSGEQSQSPPNN
jgi:hypothetical protein